MYERELARYFAAAYLLVYHARCYGRDGRYTYYGVLRGYIGHGASSLREKMKECARGGPQGYIVTNHYFTKIGGCVVVCRLSLPRASCALWTGPERTAVQYVLHESAAVQYVLHESAASILGFVSILVLAVYCVSTPSPPFPRTAWEWFSVGRTA